MAVSLDNPDLYSAVDTTNLRGRLCSFPAQCRRAWEEVLALSLPESYAHVRRVVVLGMGGSAIGGDLLAGLVSEEQGSPSIHVSRSYAPPPYVDEETLVIACSYSGETEETLTAFRKAADRGTHIVVITSGGSLAQEAQSRRLPLLRIEYRGEPRSALGYTFLTPVGILQRLGLIKDKSAAVAEAVEALERLVQQLREESPTAGNPAKEMAHQLLGRLVVVYGSGFFSAVARRWKTQLNENSKVWAFYEEIPEVHHGSVVGYSLPAEVKSQATVVLLKPNHLEERMALRYRITQELLEGEGISHRTVEAQEGTPLTQMLTTILLGDYTSYYLALLQRMDPSPVPPIDFIKGRLRT